MTDKTKRILYLTVPLLLVAVGIFAFRTPPTPTPAPPTPPAPEPTPPRPKPKPKPATIIIGNTESGGIGLPIEEMIWFTYPNATMWSYPSTVGSDIIKVFPEDTILWANQTGEFNGEVWYELDDGEGNVGWIKEIDLY